MNTMRRFPMMLDEELDEAAASRRRVHPAEFDQLREHL